jgi:hypothetical protein
MCGRRPARRLAGEVVGRVRSAVDNEKESVMATDETRSASAKVIPLNRHSSSEPARPTVADSAGTVTPPAPATAPMVQENRHSSSEPAD